MTWWLVVSLKDIVKVGVKLNYTGAGRSAQGIAPCIALLTRVSPIFSQHLLPLDITCRV